MAITGVAAALLPAWPVFAFAAQRANGGPPERLMETRSPEGPLQIFVSIDRQTLRVFDKRGLVRSSTVSTGTGGFPTPTGVFAILDKNKQHFSNIYGGASMPYMQRLTMSGVAMHSGVVTGRPASHGCIRLPHGFAVSLFDLTKLGGRVIISDEEIVPVAIEHPRLLVPKRAQVATASSLGGGLPALPGEAEPIGPADIAAAIGADLQYAFARAKVGSVSADREAELQALPVSVFISHATGRVYVRHGFLPVLDAEAQIRDSERPIGTHVYTAIEPDEDGARMRWTAVSAEKIAGTSNASQALDRIDLPAEATERISRMLGPGASLIVSDHGPSREMRSWGTDFIILTP
jgi:L,D-transpeptidase catalytic domain